VNKSLVSFASIALLVFPMEIDDLRACQNDSDNQSTQAHGMPKDVLWRIAL
jgi:hypothetical protein